MPVPADVSVYTIDSRIPIGGVGLSAGVEALDLDNNVPVGWAGIPGANIQLCLTGNIIPTVGPVTIRVRIGGLGTFRTDITGTEVINVVVPGGVATQVNAVSLVIPNPGDRSYVKITYECASNSVVDPSLMVSVIPDVPCQGALLSNAGQSQIAGGAGVEVVNGQWLLDFDKFTGSNINISFTGRFLNEGTASPASNNEWRVRVGGTYGAADGTEAVLHTAYIPTNDGAVDGSSDVFVKPVGIQPVKITITSLNGQSVSFIGCSVVLTGQ